jgi:hypothetical protein
MFRPFIYTYFMNLWMYVELYCNTSFSRKRNSCAQWALPICKKSLVFQCIPPNRMNKCETSFELNIWKLNLFNTGRRILSISIPYLFLCILSYCIYHIRLICSLHSIYITIWLIWGQNANFIETWLYKSLGSFLQFEMTGDKNRLQILHVILNSSSS